ncbi:WD40 repeat domain-containing protein [Puniceicoccus vermicola]|uniref:Uncharacterized protein n=1 Tax=Puniceicoccus vermicola TaxID=388746 RepID=A0A7X1AV98_9BACT|nr:hypothetical protein [Puniceicoccus vermicola]MBC2600437.1 hypothetical protein [Puniceicoccus vermicola]
MSSPLRKLPLRTGSGWKEVPPRETPWKIAWEGGGSLHFSDTTFRKIISGGPSGSVEAPLAYDPDSHRVFRYYCPSLAPRERENGLLSINPDTGAREMTFPLHPLRMMPWMLQKVPGRPLLMSLVVTDTSRPERPGIVLQHQLGLFHLSEKKSLFRNLPAGCQHPVAASPASDRLLFHGPDGYQLLNLKGHRQLLLSDSVWGNGRGGAAFHPSRQTFAIGGPHLALYDPNQRQRQELCSGGAFPAWTPEGQSLFYATSSSDLRLYHLETGAQEEIVSIPANRHPELKKARSVEISPDGRYFALPITRRSPYHSETVRPDQPLWSEHQTLLIGDRENRELWQHPGPVDYCSWTGISK